MDEPARPRFDFDPPPPLATDVFRLEVLGPKHNERDYQAWTTSMEHIRSTVGFENYPWPHEMTLDENLADMEMHAAEFDERTGFTYSILDGDAVIGCVYIYPPAAEPDGGASGDASVRSWVRATRAEDDAAVRGALRDWLLSPAWPFDRVEYGG